MSYFANTHTRTTATPRAFAWWHASGSIPTWVNPAFLINQPGWERQWEAGGGGPLSSQTGLGGALCRWRLRADSRRSPGAEHRTTQSTRAQFRNQDSHSPPPGAEPAVQQQPRSASFPDCTPRKGTEDRDKLRTAEPPIPEFQDRKKSFQLTPRLGVNTETSLPTWRKLWIACLQL